MGRIIISAIVSLDGVAQDPSGEEGFARGGWFPQVGDDDRRAWAELEFAEARAAAALLLGRRTDAWFAARWTERDGEWAATMNALPKYVVSSTLDEPRWTNATLAGGDAVAAATAVAAEVDGEILVYASMRLVHTLVAHDLVDELRLTVFPIVLGAGERLLGETDAVRALQLVEARTLGGGLVHLTYRRADR